MANNINHANELLWLILSQILAREIAVGPHREQKNRG
jgi:hypothetical protein